MRVLELQSYPLRKRDRALALLPLACLRWGWPSPRRNRASRARKLAF